jgi:hypothetical protein
VIARLAEPLDVLASIGIASTGHGWRDVHLAEGEFGSGEWARVLGAGSLAFP